MAATRYRFSDALFTALMTDLRELMKEGKGEEDDANAECNDDTHSALPREKMDTALSHFSELVTSWSAVQGFSSLNRVPSLIYPLGSLRVHAAYRRREAVAAWAEQRHLRRLRSQEFPSVSSLLEFGYASGNPLLLLSSRHKDIVDEIVG